ncbi:MAG: uroporphyrinogen-III C-methyltransferase [Pseudomonadota bacterium]|jgi:uroporphyrin-III C-methyltransferase
MAALGKVYLVGAGPGAPDLLTLRAARLLGCADVVFHDALVHPETLALACRARHIAVGKRCGKHSTAQAFINKRLVDAVQKHAVVVRLKGGDPMLFGRAQEEIDALVAAGIDFEVVPGITTALAAAAQISTSLTQRGISRNVCFVTPRVGKSEQPSDWAQAVLNADTAALYMGAGQAADIRDTLLARGMAADTPALLIENVSLPQSREIPCTLGSLESASAALGDGPCLIMLGEVLRAGRSGQRPVAEWLAEALIDSDVSHTRRPKVSM